MLGRGGLVNTVVSYRAVHCGVARARRKPFLGGSGGERKIWGGGLSYRAEHCGTTRASAYFTPPLAMETERERANTDRRERGSLTVDTTHSQVIGACASP